ncbi:hypothetical protein EBS80_03535, partial [bacterium]|nr:hypothetical protein [bacterium]
TWRDYYEYYSWKLSHVWLQPMSVAMSAFALIFGGWVTTVNASFDSVPGDVLYPVKLVTERVQITLATSGEQRAKLHAEFAGRRLDEINSITSSSGSDKDTRVKAAVDGFKQEIASVNDELMNIQISDPSQAASLAMIVDQKTDEYEATINQSEPSVPEGSKTDVAEALDAVQQTNSQAVNAIVDSNEADNQPQTEESLQQNFQDQLNDTNTRVALSLGRLTVIESALAKRGISNPLIATIRVDVSSHDAAVHAAMSTFAAGGYRAAFDQLSDIDARLSVAEDRITQLEIELTTGL